MTYDEAKSVLEKNGQGHVLQFWKQLSAKEREALLAQVETIDFKELKRCVAILASGGAAAAKKGKPTAPKVAPRLRRPLPQARRSLPRDAWACCSSRAGRARASATMVPRARIPSAP